MTARPQFSVVLPTRNRAASLVRALRSVCDVDRRGLDFEIVVVDNGSNDEAQRVVERAKAASPVPMRCVREPRPGLARALNRGIEAARGAIIAVTDDDQVVDRGWIRALRDCFQATGAEVVQTTRRVRLPSRTPKWLGDYGLARLGQVEGAAGPYHGHLHGGCYAVRRKVFQRIGMYHPEYGPGTARLGEDTEFTVRVRAAGIVPQFAPRAVVYHVIGQRKLRPAFFLRRAFREGRGMARLGRVTGKDYSFSRACADFVGQSLARVARLFAAPTPAGVLRVLCEEMQHLGRVAERRCSQVPAGRDEGV